MKVDLKKVLGWCCFFLILVTFASGLALMVISSYYLFIGSGEGEIKLVIKVLGEATGINGHLVIFLVGAALLVVSLGYSLKVLNQAAKLGLLKLSNLIQYFSPWH